MDRKKILLIDATSYSEYVCVKILKQQHEVTVCASCEAVKNLIQHNEEGLEGFDFIFIDPCLPRGNYYSAEETENSLHTGWFLYQDHMKGLKNTRIIVFSDVAEKHKHLPGSFPKRKWGNNVVGVVEKTCDRDFLTNLVEWASEPTEEAIFLTTL